MPQTVPNKPINGVVFPVVARDGTICIIRMVSVFVALRSALLRLSDPANLALKGRLSFSADVPLWPDRETPDWLSFFSSR